MGKPLRVLMVEDSEAGALDYVMKNNLPRLVPAIVRGKKQDFGSGDVELFFDPEGNFFQEDWFYEQCAP
jgi:hypothetical protein